MCNYNDDDNASYDSYGRALTATLPATVTKDPVMTLVSSQKCCALKKPKQVSKQQPDDINPGKLA